MFSAHPLKNLNAIGDAGYLVTNKKKFYKKALLLRNHGMENRNTIKLFGHVSRMDNFQAAVLNIRLKSLNKVIKKRRQNAKLYEKYLKNINDVKLPSDGKNHYSTFHTFLITAKKEDELRKFLLKKGISTAIHYPYLIHKLKFIKKYNHLKYNLPIAEKMVKQILTLPINQYMTKSEIKYISENIIKFYKSKLMVQIDFSKLINDYNSNLTDKLRGFGEEEYLRFWVPDTIKVKSIFNLVDAIFESNTNHAEVFNLKLSNEELEKLQVLKSIAFSILEKEKISIYIDRKKYTDYKTKNYSQIK